MPSINTKSVPPRSIEGFRDGEGAQGKHVDEEQLAQGTEGQLDVAQSKLRHGTAAKTCVWHLQSTVLGNEW